MIQELKSYFKRPIGYYGITVCDTKHLPCIMHVLFSSLSRRLQNTKENRRGNFFRGGENSKPERWEVLCVQNDEADDKEVIGLQ